MSVLVHNLNRARSLEICLASIAAQTHRPLELVLLDAGSEDDSHSVISRARATMEGVGIRTRLIRCEKLGVGASRNLAARHARGDLLCFLDNDALFQRPPGALPSPRRNSPETVVSRLSAFGCFTEIRRTWIRAHGFTGDRRTRGQVDRSRRSSLREGLVVFAPPPSEGSRATGKSFHTREKRRRSGLHCWSGAGRLPTARP